jgi:hypothetical protein
MNKIMLRRLDALDKGQTKPRPKFTTRTDDESQATRERLINRKLTSSDMVSLSDRKLQRRKSRRQEGDFDEEQPRKTIRADGKTSERWHEEGHGNMNEA